MTMENTGYTDCQCRDCFEIAIASDDGSHFCHECEDAGCDDDGECKSPNAYGSNDSIIGED